MSKPAPEISKGYLIRVKNQVHALFPIMLVVNPLIIYQLQGLKDILSHNPYDKKDHHSHLNVCQ